jgi:hypothetical protein
VKSAAASGLITNDWYLWLGEVLLTLYVSLLVRLTAGPSAADSSWDTPEPRASTVTVTASTAANHCQLLYVLSPDRLSVEYVYINLSTTPLNPTLSDCCSR